MSLFLCSFFLIVAMVNGKVCRSLDIRNTPDHILEFRNCRVIQGHLKIVLIEPSDDSSDYVNRDFPELYEITDYLLVYRVMGLTSLGAIFPKLTSIKGEKLFINNALVVYDVPHLEEIGLQNLRTIGGNVRIGNCPSLCYVDTINWKALGVSEVDYYGISNCTDESCPWECKGYCWNNYQCQTVKKDECSDACIGCTQANSTRHCLQCKFFNDGGTCVKTCPTYKVHDNEFGTCITVSECTSQQWSLFNTSCVPKCPEWYLRNLSGKCIPVNIKKCNGTKIRTDDDLMLVMGCTHIEGSLEIALYNYISPQDLEIALGNIQTIDGFLKISRSHVITSLAFFKNLTKIGGKKLFSTYYSLFVTDNLNLQELFPNNLTVKIQHGEALFQNNSLLCPSKINKFTVKVTSVHNGLQTVCNFTEFEVRVVEKNSTNVTLSWIEKKNVLGYAVYYIRAKGASSLRVRECFVDGEGESEYGWSSVFVQNNTVLLNNLAPFTSYSYYIKTVGTNTLRSPIYGFKTSTGDPYEPMDLEVDSTTESLVALKWRPPIFLNGELSHYRLTIYMLKDNATLVRERNYCIYPLEESKCSCPVKDEVRLIHPDGVCIGSESDKCKNTVYVMEKLRFQRSVRTVVIEHIIKDNTYNPKFDVYDLNHFTLYTFFVQACNKPDTNESAHCGGSVMASLRTPMRRGADTVTNVTLRGEDNVTLTWSAPKDPNSMVVAHKIEYNQLETNNITSVCLSEICEQCEYTIASLEPGKYSVRVSAVSLAASGEFSDWIYFEISSEKSSENSSESRIDWIYGLLAFFGSVILVLFVTVLRHRNQRTNVDVDSLVRRIRTESDDEWKLDDETVEIIRELGQNSIGVIYRNL